MQSHSHKSRDKFIWPWRATLCPRMINGKEALPPSETPAQGGNGIPRAKGSWKTHRRLPRGLAKKYPQAAPPEENTHRRLPRERVSNARPNVVNLGAPSSSGSNKNSSSIGGDNNSVYSAGISPSHEHSNERYRA